jgi:D-arabinose 1-dehydrogenase-like Zn-dependent alcohol dehydrogenase
VDHVIEFAACWNFTAQKNIVPTIQKLSLTIAGIEEAMQPPREGKMRYRGILVREQ